MQMLGYRKKYRKSWLKNNAFYKYPDSGELEVYNLILEKGLGFTIPWIYGMKGGCIFMKKYPTDVFEFIQEHPERREEVAKEALFLFEELAWSGILQTDFHSSNIVVNPKNMSVRLIDFGLCNRNWQPSAVKNSAANNQMKRALAVFSWSLGIPVRTLREWVLPETLPFLEDLGDGIVPISVWDSI